MTAESSIVGIEDDDDDDDDAADKNESSPSSMPSPTAPIGSSSAPIDVVITSSNGTVAVDAVESLVVVVVLRLNTEHEKFKTFADLSLPIAMTYVVSEPRDERSDDINR